MHIPKNARLTGYDLYHRPTVKLRPKVKALKDWIDWMIGGNGPHTGGKGFVVIGGVLHRNCNPTWAGVKETMKYHEEDVGYKWDRYFAPLPYTVEIKEMLFEKFDIKHRTVAEQTRIMEGFNEANNRREP